MANGYSYGSTSGGSGGGGKGGGFRNREIYARKFVICLIKMCKESSKVKLHSLSLRKKQKAGKIYSCISSPVDKEGK